MTLTADSTRAAGTVMSIDGDDASIAAIPFAPYARINDAAVKPVIKPFLIITAPVTRKPKRKKPIAKIIANVIKLDTNELLKTTAPLSCTASGESTLFKYSVTFAPTLSQPFIRQAQPAVTPSASIKNNAAYTPVLAPLSPLLLIFIVPPPPSILFAKFRDMSQIYFKNG